MSGPAQESSGRAVRRLLAARPHNYAHYMVLTVLRWLASVRTRPLPEAGDEVQRAWFTCRLDLYGGLGRDAWVRPRFD